MQPFYQEWALEISSKLMGKVRNAVMSYPPFTGEKYVNGRAYVVYRGDNKEEAQNAVIQSLV